MGRIREARLDDLIRVKQMTDAYISRDFYSLSYLEDILRDENQYLFVYTDEKDEAVAYLYMFDATLREALGVLHISYDIAQPRERDLDARVGVYKTTCTEKDYRGKGILTSFLAYVEDVFVKKGIGTILLTALQIPNGRIPTYNVLDHAGFQRVGSVEHPWIEVDAYCPYCGHQHCTCNAVVYKKEIL